jgi:hypothetical protein
VIPYLEEGRSLYELAAVVTICGDSYRLREKLRSGLFRPQTGGTSPPVPVKED